MTKKTKTTYISVFLIIVILVAFYIFKVSKPKELTSIPVSKQQVIENSGFEPLLTEPALTITQKSNSELLPGFPAHFPATTGQVVSSYVGTSKSDSNEMAYGATWKFSNTNVPDVMKEEFLNQQKYQNDSIESNWTIDEIPHPTDVTKQTLRAHTKTGNYVWLTVTQDGRDVTAHAEFILNQYEKTTD